MKRRSPNALVLVSVAALAAATAACASSDVPENAPAWYAESLETPTGDYPSLRDVPREPTANTDPAHWAAVQAELDAATAAARASPRAQPAPAQDPNAFAEEARRDIEATRDTH